MPLTQPYADRHQHLNGPGDERPTAEEVVHDQAMVDALKGSTILITGCTSGIGIETARALYQTGAKVYITGRDVQKGEKVARELSIDPARPVHFLELSLDSFESVRQAARKFLERESKLNILINNAGVMACPQGVTADGYETQFGTNHLGHFLLFQLLKPALLAAASPDFPSRVVSLSSTGHRFCESFPFDDLDFSKSEYQPFVAYGRSKLANVYFANELTRRYASENLYGLSLHPGSITTPLQRFVISDSRIQGILSDPSYRVQVKNVEQGAATTVWAAIAKELTGRGGIYLENVGEADKATPDGGSFRPGYSAAAFCPKDETKLWGLSSELCGIAAE